MNHATQNGLKASAYLLGITVEELIDVLHNASKVKEIRTPSGQPFSLPSRPSQTQPTPEVYNDDLKRRRSDTDVFKEPNYSDAEECKRAVGQLCHALDYFQIEATYWYGMWFNNLSHNSMIREARASVALSKGNIGTVPPCIDKYEVK